MPHDGLNMKIAINTYTSGKYKRETINGRSHVVTSMMPIRGDVTMNGIMYPNDEIKSSFQQLNKLPAPNGHPKVNGVHISAFDPVAMNAHNVGGFIRNPKMKGKEVFTDFLIDETVANLSADGVEIIRRIENGEKIGVSTGLTIDQVSSENGEDDFGMKFNQVGRGFNFDHVAILLNEKAAGDHAGTELRLNTENPDDPIFVVNLAVISTNDLTADDMLDKLNTMIQSADDDVLRWVVDIFPESHIFIWSEKAGTSTRLFKQSYSVSSNDEISIIDIPVEVKLQKEFKPTITNEDHDMNNELLVLAMIGLTTNAFTGDDKDRLMAMSESELVNELAVNTENAIDADKAKEVLTANGFDFAAFDSFQTNAESFKAYQEAEKDRLDGIKTSITAANSDYTPELLEGKTEAELLVINKMVESNKTATRAPEGSAPVVNSQAKTSDNYDM